VRRTLVIGCTIFCCVFLWQAMVARDERDLLGRELDARERQVEKAKAATADAELVSQETEDYRASIRRMRKILPKNLGVHDFLLLVSKVANEQHVEVVSAEPRLVRGEFYDTAEIALELVGEQEATHAVLDRLRRGRRLVGAEGLDTEAGRTRVTLLLFASPYAEPKWGFTPCVLAPSRVWAPGLRGPLRALRTEVEATCAKAETMAGAVQKVNMLMGLREETLFLTELVEELVSHHPPPTEQGMADS